MSEAEDLRQWMADTDEFVVDAVLEFLHDRGCLNKKGEELARGFWRIYIKEKVKA